MGSDLHMNPPTVVKRCIVDQSGFLVLQVKWDYEDGSHWKQEWRGPNTEGSRALLTAATGITEFGPIPTQLLRYRLQDVGISDISQQNQILEQVAHWLEDHASDEMKGGGEAGARGARLLAMHAKEALR